MFKIAVDFDETLITQDEDGNYTAVSGAAESMQKLRDKGCTIVIYTCRTGIAAKNRNLHDEVAFIEEILTFHNIVFDEIFLGEKLVADFYIDDRAISFKGNWTDTLKDAEDNISKLTDVS